MSIQEYVKARWEELKHPEDCSLDSTLKEFEVALGHIEDLLTEAVRVEEVAEVLREAANDKCELFYRQERKIERLQGEVEEVNLRSESLSCGYAKKQVELIGKLAVAQAKLEKHQGLGNPHGVDPKNCPTFYDGCHCTVETLIHNIDRAEKAEAELHDLSWRNVSKGELPERLENVYLKCEDDFNNLVDEIGFLYTGKNVTEWRIKRGSMRYEVPVKEPKFWMPIPDEQEVSDE